MWLQQKDSYYDVKTSFFYINNIASAENKEHIKPIFVLQNDTFTNKWGKGGELKHFI